MGEAATALRGELRQLVAEHVPPDFLGAFTDDPADLESTQSFCRLLAERGLLCLAWPEECGGRGASLWEQTVVREEMWAHHEPRGAQYMGVNWVGPTIMRHGTAEQQRQHLPPIARRRGDLVPGLQRARRRLGPGLAADGGPARRRRSGASPARRSGPPTRRWRSGASCSPGPRAGRRSSTASRSSWCRCPLPAIEVRPIATMIGPHHLNEVFFDDLRVTEADVLGQVDEGWQVAQEVLAFERVGIARYARCERLLHAAPAALGDEWDTLPAELRAGGRGCSRTAGGPGCWPTGWWRSRARAGSGRAMRRLPDRGHPARPGQRRGADGDRRPTRR